MNEYSKGYIEGGGDDWRKIEKNAPVSKYPYAGETHKYVSFIDQFYT